MYSLPWPYVNAAPGAEGAGQSRLAGHPTDGPPARSFAPSFVFTMEPTSCQAHLPPGGGECT